jgi:6-phosphogluconolactonase
MHETCLQFEDERNFGRTAAAHLGRVARQVLETRPLFRLALSGGRSPLPLFEALRDPDLFPTNFWGRTHVFFADERMVPSDHPDSNFGLASRHLLDHVPIPAANVHPMPAHLPLEAAATRYAQTLTDCCGCLPGQTPVLDLVVLGMGADGHTASLFPDARLPEDHPLVAPVPTPSAMPHVPRLTLTPRVLNSAREIVFLILGADKHAALLAIDNGDDSLPAARVDVCPQSWYICPPLPTNPTPHGRFHGRFQRHQMG